MGLVRSIGAILTMGWVCAHAAARSNELPDLQAEVQRAAAELRAAIERMDGKYGRPGSSSRARATVEQLDITEQLDELTARFRANHPRRSHQLPDYGREFSVNAGDRVHGTWYGSGAYRWTDWFWVEVEARELVNETVRRVSPRDYLLKQALELDAAVSRIRALIEGGEEGAAVFADPLRASLRAVAEKQTQIELIFDGSVLRACREVGALQLAVGRAMALHLETLSGRHPPAAREQALKLRDQAKAELATESLEEFAPVLQQVRSAVATPIPIALQAVSVTLVGQTSAEEVDSVAEGEPFSVLIRYLVPPRDEGVGVQLTSPSDRERRASARRVAGRAGTYRADGLRVALPGQVAEEDGEGAADLVVLRANPGDTIGAWLEGGGHDTVPVRPGCDQLRADIAGAEKEFAELEREAAQLSKLIQHDETEMALAQQRIQAKEEQTGHLERKKQILDAELDRLSSALNEITRARGELLGGLPQAARYHLALEMYDVRDSRAGSLTEAEQRDFMFVAGKPGGTFDAVVLQAKLSNVTRFAWGLGQVAKIAMNLEPLPGGGRFRGASSVWQVWGEQVFGVRDPGQLAEPEFLDSDPAFKQAISLPGSMAMLQGEAKRAYDELVNLLRAIEEKQRGGADDAALQVELGKVNARVVDFLKHLKGVTDALSEQQTRLAQTSDAYEKRLDAIGMLELRAAYEYLEVFLKERRLASEGMRVEIERLQEQLNRMEKLQAKHCGDR